MRFFGGCFNIFFEMNITNLKRVVKKIDMP